MPMNKRFLIAIDDGHGMETAGKRTPLLPDGTVMRENEFSRRVAQLLAAHLMRCGQEILLVAPSDNDTPLKARTAAANKAKADFYISIHANATGGGSFNSVRGIETYHYPGSIEGRAAAEIIHRHLLSGTKLPDRGVKSADFHVLRETSMPAVLVECGFMTNLDDAALLRTEAYRAECAAELAAGICEYLGVAYAVESDEDPLPSISRRVAGRLNGRLIEDGYLIDGKTYIPLREIAEEIGARVDWDPVKFEYDMKEGE